MSRQAGSPPEVKLYLASASPRRTELLTQIGLVHQLVSVDVPEHRLAGETPEQYSLRVARAKAEAGFAALDRPAGASVLGADTEVVLDGDIFGKPRDLADAASMLRRLSGKTHAVLSSVALCNTRGTRSILQQSSVRFRDLSDADIDLFLCSGEAMGKAGAYAIQGQAAAFIAELRGSYSGVMGLPLFETCELLRQIDAPFSSL